MLKITDSQAMRLERLVRAVYGCERFGVAHMADADYLGKYPFHAALLILAPRLRASDIKDISKIENFLYEYEECLTNSTVEKYDEALIDDYVKNLESLVRRYYRCLAPLKMTRITR